MGYRAGLEESALVFGINLAVPVIAVLFAYLIMETIEALRQRRAGWLRREVRVGGAASVDRNAPCPCGSGRKYKRCCGAKAR